VKFGEQKGEYVRVADGSVEGKNVWKEVGGKRAYSVEN
jgi:hypothetical protein